MRKHHELRAWQEAMDLIDNKIPFPMTRDLVLQHSYEDQRSSRRFGASRKAGP